MVCFIFKVRALQKSGICNKKYLSRNCNILCGCIAMIYMWYNLLCPAYLSLVMEDSGIQRGIWDGDAKAVQQCLTDIFTSVYTTCDIPENAIFGPCVLSHTSLYDSIAFIALKSTDKRTVPYIFRVSVGLCCVGAWGPQPLGNGVRIILMTSRTGSDCRKCSNASSPSLTAKTKYKLNKIQTK